MSVPATQGKTHDDFFAEKIAEIPEIMDTEEGHMVADGVLCGILEKLGYPKTVKAFRELDKWYSCILVALLLTAPANAAECKYLRIHDADTFMADIYLGFGVVLKDRVIRIAEYDAWEVSRNRRTLKLTDEQWLEEITKGKAAKLALEELIGEADKVEVQEVAEKDPYGRLLLRVYADGVSVGETLRAQGHERTEKRVSTLKND